MKTNPQVGEDGGGSSAGSFISDSYFPLDGSWEDREASRDRLSARDLLYPDDRQYFGQLWTL